MKTYRYLLMLSLVNTVIGLEELESQIRSAITYTELEELTTRVYQYNSDHSNPLTLSPLTTNQQIQNFNAQIERESKKQARINELLRLIEARENDLKSSPAPHLGNTIPHKPSYLSSLFSILWPKKALRTLWDKCVDSRYGQQATKWFTTAAKFTKRQTQKHIRTYRNGPCTII